MVMKEIYNNSPHTLKLRYSVNGRTIRTDIAPFTRETIAMLDHFDQIINKRDRDVLIEMETGDIDDSTPSGRAIISKTGFKVPRVFFGETQKNFITFDHIRASLSKNNKVIYDSLEENMFMQVSRSEYEAIAVATKSSAYGVSNQQMASDGFMNSIGGEDFVLSDENTPTASIPSGNYIIGYKFKQGTGIEEECVSHISLSDSIGSGVEVHPLTRLSNDLTFEPSALPIVHYAIRKQPTTTTNVKKYFSVYSSQPRAIDGIDGVFPMFSSTNDGGIWNNTESGVVMQQVIATTVDSWTI